MTKSNAIYIRIDEEILKEVDKAAKKQDRSRSNMILILIKKALKEIKK